MAWLARSIADGLRLDADDEAADTPDDDEENDDDPEDVRIEDRERDSSLVGPERRSSISEGDASDEDSLGRGVKEDFSEIRDSLTRQFWGVASFLAPPPPPPPPPPPFSRKSDLVQIESEYGRAGSDNDDEEDNDYPVDFEGRGSGQFEELERFSAPEDYYERILEEAIGITEEALAFARNIAHHPETWLDFPLEEEEFGDFEIADAQYKHLLAIEHLAPRLAALRFEFCPVHMSEGYFWMVYFVLLHSRLNKHDADLLSSPQIVQARGMWIQELQKRTKEETYWPGRSTFDLKESAFSPRETFRACSYDEQSISDQIPPVESSSHQVTADDEVEKHLVNEIEFIDKPVIREDPSPLLQEKEMVVGSSFVIPVPDDNDDDGWVTDDSDLIGFPGPSVPVNEEDISFSDLEDDLDATMPIKSKTASAGEKKSTKT